MGNPVEMIYPDTTKISQEYDIAGRLIKFINKRGQEINYTYDEDGKLITKTTPEGNINFTYDERDRITEIQAADFNYRYSYGVVDGGWLGVVGNSIVVKEEMSPAGIASLDASEDLGIVMLTNYHGLPRETFDSFGWHKLFTYDFTATPVAYAPVQIIYGKRYVEYDKLTINNSYDNGLRVYRKTNSRFNNETFQYFDTNGLMSGVLYRPLSGYTGCWPNGKLNFTRDNSGLIEQITDDLALTATYNPDLEIISVNHTVPQPFDESYTYDSRGNRLTDMTKTYLYDSLNKLIESTTHLYGYDLDGNMTLEKSKLTGETKKYYWDSENRLVKYEHQANDISPIDITAEYKYDIYGRRIQKNVNETVTNFMWEGDNLSMELDASNQPIKKYFTELAMDDYFGQLEYSEVTNWSKIFDYSYPQGWYGYIKDQVGTIYRVWDRNLKQYAETRTYDTFGNMINFTGTTKTNLGFQGKYYDTESGLNYFYHRYYSPSIGRFISEDPIGLRGGLNQFNFVDSNPIKFTDLFGLENYWKDEMPNRDGLRAKDGGFLALFGASPYKILQWTIQGSIRSLKNGVTGSKLSCPCEQIFWDCMRDHLLPGFGDMVEVSGYVLGNFMQIYGWAHAATRHLIVPMSSSIVRFWVNNGKMMSPTVAAGYFAYGVWRCLIKELICLSKE